MTKILLTRHGHVDGIRPARFRGRAELPLTDHGLAQADALARRIAQHWKPVAVYTSPLQRCVVTGARIAAACGIAASVHEGLGDIDYGAWQMRTHEEVSAETPEAYRLWREKPHLVRFPGGESLQDVVARTADALRWCWRGMPPTPSSWSATTASTARSCCNSSTSRCRPTGGCRRIPAP
jgi:probable phosphoglycerate mutase